MENDVNSFDKEIENVQNTNSQSVDNGTQENDNSTNETLENVAQTVDYQKKFSESAKEAQRLYEENKRLREQFQAKDKVQEQFVPAQNTDNYYPGFEDLDEDAKNNLIAYTDTVTKRALAEINKNPAIAYATKQYNEQVWDSAFQKTIQEYPELAESKDEFKSKYYNVNNVPQNIESILKDVAKIHLFDKAKEIGAKEQTEKQNRVDIERTTAGSKDPTVRRSLEDWQRMAQENPMQFRSLSKEFNDDMSSGKI
jgi:hypothetical protein